MRKCSYFFLMIAGFLLTTVTGVAAENTVTDNAGLFTPSEIQSLSEQADKLNEKIKGEVFIATTNNEIDDIEYTTDRFLADRIGNDQNGSALMIDMGNRNFHVSTSGNMIDYITNSRREDMLDNIYDQMAAGNYYQAARVYLENAASYVEAGVPGGHYQVDRETGKITYYKVLTTTVTGVAAENTVTDNAGLFTPSEIQSLSEQADKLNEKIKGEVFIATTNNEIDDIEYTTDRFLADRIGNDQNGSALMIDMGNRNFHVSTSGNMIDYITNSRREDMLDNIYDQMAAGNYYQAARVYLENAASYVEAGVPGGHYQVDRETGKITYYKVLTPLEIGLSLLVAAVISIAFFIIVKSKYQLKMGGYKYPYQEKSSIKLTQKEDRLVNSFVTTRRIPRPPKNNGGGGGFGGGSTTHSSGGGTFGGGGRSF